MKINISKKYLILVLAFALLPLDACRKKYAATAEDMVEYGWDLYETADYLNSNKWFNDAIVDDDEWKDAYNGLGWSYAKLMAVSYTHLTLPTKA